MDRVFSVTETFYQYQVVNGCRYFSEAYHIGWNVRNDFPFSENKRVHIVKTRLGFMLSSLRALMKSDSIIIGDFRSTIQLMLIYLAFFFRKNIVLSEDGIISNIADCYHFEPGALDDGGVRRWKLPFIAAIAKRLDRCDRITTEPEFLKALRKPIQVYASTPQRETATSPNSNVAEEDEVRVLIFAGQYLPIIKVNFQVMLENLSTLSNRYPQKYERLIYARHPRDSQQQSKEIDAIGWENAGSFDQVINQFSSVAIASINSTCLLKRDGRIKERILLEISTLLFPDPGVRRTQYRVQSVIKKILRSRGIKEIQPNVFSSVTESYFE